MDSPNKNEGNNMDTPTNSDIVARLDELEAKVDHICALMEQANGAWFFVKLCSTIALGIAVIYNAIHSWVGR